MAFTEEDKQLITAMLELIDNLYARVDVLEKKNNIKNIVYVPETIVEVNELSDKLLVVEAI